MTALPNNVPINPINAIGDMFLDAIVAARKPRVHALRPTTTEQLAKAYQWLLSAPIFDGIKDSKDHPDALIARVWDRVAGSVKTTLTDDGISPVARFIDAEYENEIVLDMTQLVADALHMGFEDGVPVVMQKTVTIWHGERDEKRKFRLRLVNFALRPDGRWVASYYASVEDE